MIKKMDPKLVAEKQQHEVAYISKKFKITSKNLKAIMLQIGKNGKPCRSRKVIYAKLRSLGFTVLK